MAAISVKLKFLEISVVTNIHFSWSNQTIESINLWWYNENKMKQDNFVYMFNGVYIIP